ncbi:XRE family transcriptional regulator [Sulfurimonas sp.]|uniref:helix-turn-helix domain-containing protein n=1 Tax=Sulfurimonas sp. TaxID=2022749 RepID=UPI0025FC0AAC|nr:XRE family transcriptional regulator [Sulfurimonas sp.]
MQEITIEDLYQTIGRNVARYRKEKKMSQLSLSMVMGYKSVSVVSSGEICYKGKHFNLEQIHKISKILKVPITKLFEEE